MAERSRGSGDKDLLDSIWEATDLGPDPKQPWLAEDGVTVRWNNWRVDVASVLLHPMFEAFMCAAAILNTALVVIEVNRVAECHPRWTDNLNECPYTLSSSNPLSIINRVLLVVYTSDLILHALVWRLAVLRLKTYYCELIVVVVGWTTIIAGNFVNFSWLRLFRLIRFLLTFRAAASVREFNLMLSGLWTTFKAALFGTMLLALVLGMLSTVMVEFVHPVSSTLEFELCDRCRRGFSSVWTALLTLFEHTLGGYSWGQMAVPVIEKNPWLATILVAAVLTITIGIMNLITAVVVRSISCMELQEGSKSRAVESVVEASFASRTDLLKCCAAMDQRGTRRLTLPMVRHAWDNNEEFRNLVRLLGITCRELDSAFEVLDMQKNGEVDYFQLVALLYRPRHENYEVLKANLAEFRQELWVQLEAGFQSILQRLGEKDDEQGGTHSREAPEEILTSHGRKLAPSQKLCLDASGEDRGVESMGHPGEKMYDAPHLDSDHRGKKVHDVPPIEKAIASLADAEIRMARSASEKLAEVRKSFGRLTQSGRKGGSLDVVEFDGASDWLEHHVQTRLNLLMQDVHRCCQVQAGLFDCTDHLLSNALEAACVVGNDVTNVGGKRGDQNSSGKEVHLLTAVPEHGADSTIDEARAAGSISEIRANGVISGSLTPTTWQALRPAPRSKVGPTAGAEPPPAPNVDDESLAPPPDIDEKPEELWEDYSENLWDEGWLTEAYWQEGPW